MGSIALRSIAPTLRFKSPSFPIRLFEGIEFVLDALHDGEAESGFGVEVEFHDFHGDGVLVAFPLVGGESDGEVGGPFAKLFGGMLRVSAAEDAPAVREGEPPSGVEVQEVVEDGVAQALAD